MKGEVDLYRIYSRFSRPFDSNTNLVIRLASLFYSLLGSLEVKIKNTWLMKLTNYYSGLIALSVYLKICLVFRREDKEIISQFCWIGKDTD